MTSSLVFVPINRLLPHPDNPRIGTRPDLVDAIAESIRLNGFQQHNAILVRPFEDDYQIISGHRRTEAAQMAGLTEIPAWISALSDQDAFLQLVLENRTNELTLLEIGLHARKQLSPDGHRTMTVQEYARLVGKSYHVINKAIQAANVVLAINKPAGAFLDVSTHLASINAAPPEDWEWISEMLLENSWSVSQTNEAIRAVQEIAAAPEIVHRALDLAYWKQIVAIAAAQGDPTALKTFTQLATAVKDRANELLTDRPVWIIEDDISRSERWDLQAIFLERIAKTERPNKDLVGKMQTVLLKEVSSLDEAHLKWQREKASEVEKTRLEEARLAAIAALREEYEPKGYKLLQVFDHQFDAIAVHLDGLYRSFSMSVREDIEVIIRYNLDVQRGFLILFWSNVHDLIDFYNEIGLITWQDQGLFLDSAYKQKAYIFQQENSQYTPPSPVGMGASDDQLLSYLLPEGGRLLEIGGDSHLTLECKRRGYHAEYITPHVEAIQLKLGDISYPKKLLESVQLQST
jgi:ParB/RepB/Spo0J family partition protein